MYYPPTTHTIRVQTDFDGTCDVTRRRETVTEPAIHRTPDCVSDIRKVSSLSPSADEEMYHVSDDKVAAGWSRHSTTRVDATVAISVARPTATKH